MPQLAHLKNKTGSRGLRFRSDEGVDHESIAQKSRADNLTERPGGNRAAGPNFFTNASIGALVHEREGNMATHLLHWAIVITIFAIGLRPRRTVAVVASLPGHVKRHGARIGAAGFFWTLAAWRSMREGSIEPLIHHAEWRAAWRVAREV